MTVRGTHQCFRMIAGRRSVVKFWYCSFCLPQIKTLRKCAVIKDLKMTDSTQRFISVCGPCKHTSAQSSRFLAKNPFSFLSLQWFPLLKTNATARYLSLIRGYLYGSYLKVTHEMKNKLFLLFGASVSFLFFFLTAHISTSVLQHCFNTP